MSEHDTLARQFETSRNHLRAVAYRMLGSTTEADDAVQEAWLRVSRADADDVDNMGGWLTTIVSRVCLDVLRSRRARAEESLGAHEPEPSAGRRHERGTEADALLADSVGMALVVVLEKLAPGWRRRGRGSIQGTRADGRGRVGGRRDRPSCACAPPDAAGVSDRVRGRRTHRRDGCGGRSGGHRKAGACVAHRFFR